MTYGPLILTWFSQSEQASVWHIVVPFERPLFVASVWGTLLTGQWPKLAVCRPIVRKTRKKTFKKLWFWILCRKGLACGSYSRFELRGLGPLLCRSCGGKLQVIALPPSRNVTTKPQPLATSNQRKKTEERWEAEQCNKYSWASAEHWRLNGKGKSVLMEDSVRHLLNHMKI